MFSVLLFTEGTSWRLIYVWLCHSPLSFLRILFNWGHDEFTSTLSFYLDLRRLTADNDNNLCAVLVRASFSHHFSASASTECVTERALTVSYTLERYFIGLLHKGQQTTTNYPSDYFQETALLLFRAQWRTEIAWGFSRFRELEWWVCFITT